MESAGHPKGSESSSGSRPGLRSCAALPSAEVSSMGQNALGTLVNGSVEEPQPSTASIADVHERRRTSDRNALHPPIVNMRGNGSSNSGGKDQGLALSHDVKAQRRPEVNRTVNGSVCLHCGGSLEVKTDNENFKELYQLQLQLIDEQRATLLEREAELQELREVKNKLETRLSRMERNLSAMPGGCEFGSGDSLGSPTTPNVMCAKLSDAPRASAKQPDCFAFGSELSSRSPSPCRRKVKPVKRHRTPRPDHVVTNVLYDAPLLKHTASALCRDSEPAGDRGNEVAVPSWRVVEDDQKLSASTLRRSTGGKDTENLSDDTFLQRHSKHETEEKRIKRWDLQRVRTQTEHEKLRKRYEEKEVKWHNQSAGETHEVISSFLPKPDDLKEIYITNDLPVVAFGAQVPNMPKAEFKLPWFDPTKRAAEGGPRKTRSKARSRPSEGK